MVEDSRKTLKGILDANIDEANMETDTTGVYADWHVAWIQNDECDFEQVFFDKGIDVLFGVGMPLTRPLKDFDKTVYGAAEKLTVKIYVINKPHINALKIIGKADIELRRVIDAQSYPWSIDSGTPAHLRIGGLTIYSMEYKVDFVRSNV